MNTIEVRRGRIGGLVELETCERGRVRGIDSTTGIARVTLFSISGPAGWRDTPQDTLRSIPEGEGKEG